MMFLADNAFGTELIALILGTGLLLWAGKEEVCCKGFAKFVAYFAILSSILAMLCTSYYTVRYWEDGHFKNPQSMSMSSMKQMKGQNGMGMMDPAMMQEMMKNCLNRPHFTRHKKVGINTIGGIDARKKKIHS